MFAILSQHGVSPLWAPSTMIQDIKREREGEETIGPTNKRQCTRGGISTTATSTPTTSPTGKKRSTAPFIAFKAAYKQQNPEKIVGKESSEHGKICSEEWKKLSKEEKQSYVK